MGGSPRWQLAALLDPHLTYRRASPWAEQVPYPGGIVQIWTVVVNGKRIWAAVNSHLSSRCSRYAAEMNGRAEAAVESGAGGAVPNFDAIADARAQEPRYSW